MGRTQELRIQAHGASVLPAVGGGALILIVAASLVLLLHPSAAHDLSRLYTSLRATGQVAAWGDSVLRASVAAACASAAIYVLVSFGRGVQSAPFLWLSPVLLGFGMTVMMRMRVAPALPMQELVFYVLSACSLLGGGALLQRRGWAGALSGSLLLMLPLVVLCGGYAQQAGGVSLALGQLNSGAALHGFVLLVMSVGLGFIAVTTRDEVMPAAQARAALRRYGHHADADAVDAAMESARISELRVQAAEQRVSVAEQQLRMQSEELENALAIQDDIRHMAPRRIGVRLLVTGFALIAVFGAFMAAFFGLYRPLQLKAAQAQALVAHLEQAQKQAVAGLDAERATWRGEIDKARGAATESEANIAKLQAEVATLLAAQAALVPVAIVEAPVAATTARATPMPSTSTRAKVRAVKKKRVVAARVERREPAAAPTRAPVRAARAESRDGEMNDDPIAGLDL